jgi:hypothetical protein
VGASFVGVLNTKWATSGKPRGPATEQLRSELIDRNRSSCAALWHQAARCASIRFQLHYVIRDDLRLTWWRTDNRENATTRQNIRRAVLSRL